MHCGDGQQWASLQALGCFALWCAVRTNYNTITRFLQEMWPFINEWCAVCGVSALLSISAKKPKNDKTRIIRYQKTNIIVEKSGLCTGFFLPIADFPNADCAALTTTNTQ